MFLKPRHVAQAVIWIATPLLAVPAIADPAPLSIPSAPLTLAQAEGRLTRVNPGILGAKQAQEALRHRAVAASQLPDPEIGLMAENFPANNLLAPSQGPNAMLNLALSQRLPAFGQRAHLRDELQKVSQAARDGIAVIQAEDILALRLAWLDATYASQALATLARQRDLERETIQAALARFRAGFAPEVDVLRAQLDEKALGNRIFPIQAEYAAARARIAELLDERTPPALAINWPAIPMPPAMWTVEKDLALNPMLRQSAALSHAASAGVKVAESDYYPQVTLFGSYGESYYPGMPNGITLGIDITLPIFTSERQDQTLDAARARARASQYAYQQRSLALLKEVRTLFAQSASAQMQLKRTEEVLLPTAKAAFAAALVEYAEGESDMTSLLKTQRAILEFSLDAIRLHQEFLDTQAELDYLATHVERPS